LMEVRKVAAWIKIPFIFLTARSEKIDVQRGKRLGVDDYLTKPFDADDLLIAVESRLNRHKVLNEVYDNAMSTLKRNILTILNHEFRTPLTFVVAYADMLNDQAQQLSDEELLSFLRGVNTGALRLRRLIENFIQLVEMETGDAQKAYDLRKAPINNLLELIESARLEVYNVTNYKQPFSVEVEGEPVTFVGDGHYLQLALTQLIDNAVKFSSQDQPITVGVRYSTGEVDLWVQDHGRGIDLAEQERIWESFYQIDRATFEDQGTGSGLAIVNHVATLHGGHTEVESRLGEGSRFTICIPVQNQV
jgi:two-component system, sensor histidine kinase and response regulator